MSSIALMHSIVYLQHGAGLHLLKGGTRKGCSEVHLLRSSLEQHNEAKIGRAPELKVVQTRARFQLCSEARKASRRRALNALDLCRIAFDKRRNRAADSDAYMVSKATVLRGLVLTCHTVLEQQLAMMRDFASWVVAHKPDAAAAGLCWDETSQILALGKKSVHGTELGLQQQRSSWNVLVARLHFCVAFRNGPKIYREMVLPPVPLPSNSSAEIYLGLRKHPLSRGLIDYVQDILLAARHRIMLHEGMMWACAVLSLWCQPSQTRFFVNLDSGRLLLWCCTVIEWGLSSSKTARTRTFFGF